MQEIVISKEHAVFWMDEHGRWCNAHGLFEHRKIIDYFNACIRKDQKGYFVEQIRDDVREKVYFRYEDTPLFAVDMLSDNPLEVVLNTGNSIKLDPRLLFVRDDNLYLRQNEDRIKFNERVLLKLAHNIDVCENKYYFHFEGSRYPIPEA
jgi:hypothetical protein